MWGRLRRAARTTLSIRPEHSLRSGQTGCGLPSNRCYFPIFDLYLSFICRPMQVSITMLHDFDASFVVQINCKSRPYRAPTDLSLYDSPLRISRFSANQPWAPLFFAFNWICKAKNTVLALSLLVFSFPLFFLPPLSLFLFCSFRQTVKFQCNSIRFVCSIWMN